jgi:hypothetical protein
MNTLKIVLGIVLTVLFFSCEMLQEKEEQENGSGMGMLIVNITDAPFPSILVSEANITIERVELKCSESVNKNKQYEAASDSFTVLTNEEQYFNLLDLKNGIKALLASVEIPEGIYNEIRLFISEAGIKLTNGKVYNLKVPSGASGGLKIKIKPALYIFPNTENEVLLDFDVSRSFKVKGNPKNKHGIKGFMFKPVVRAVNNSLTGSIQGTVSNGEEKTIENAMVTLFSQNDTITSAITDSKGYYAIIGVPEGLYEIECNHEDYTKTDLNDIEVISGEKKRKDFVLMK